MNFYVTNFYYAMLAVSGNLVLSLTKRTRVVKWETRRGRESRCSFETRTHYIGFVVIALCQGEV